MGRPFKQCESKSYKTYKNYVFYEEPFGTIEYFQINAHVPLPCSSYFNSISYTDEQWIRQIFSTDCFLSMIDCIVVLYARPYV